MPPKPTAALPVQRTVTASKADPSGRCRLLVVDDHPLFRAGVLSILSTFPEMEVVGTAGTAAEAKTRFRELKPDVTLMDLRLPDESGATVIRELKLESPQSAFIVLTTYDGDEDIFRALEAGGSAYLLKDMSGDEMRSTINRVQKGDICLSPTAASRLAERINRPSLTDRELDLLRMLARGRSNKEIGSDLNLSEETVKWYLKSIFAKLEVHDRTQAVLVSLKRGIVHLDSQR
jgi:DNA-binding NarL/FixJ family response regulator